LITKKKRAVIVLSMEVYGARYFGEFKSKSTNFLIILYSLFWTKYVIRVV